MSKAPDVSVVMSVHNGWPLLHRALSSVLAQEGCTFEFIVIDDGSTDGTAAILDHYAAKDTRLQILHQENVGLTMALRRGCSLATGEFIARQDAGDVSCQTRLMKQLNLLRPIYQKTAAYGHFGREEPEFAWEKTDKAAALKAAAGV